MVVLGSWFLVFSATDSFLGVVDLVLGQTLPGGLDALGFGWLEWPD